MSYQNKQAPTAESRFIRPGDCSTRSTRQLRVRASPPTTEPPARRLMPGWSAAPTMSCARTAPQTATQSTSSTSSRLVQCPRAMVHPPAQHATGLSTCSLRLSERKTPQESAASSAALAPGASIAGCPQLRCGSRAWGRLLLPSSLVKTRKDLISNNVQRL